MFSSSAVIRSVLTSILVVWLAARVSIAQSSRGTIAGSVTRENQDAIALVDVSATNEDTGVVTAAQSNERGLYALLDLPPGTYTVEFKKAGFAPIVRKGITVGVQSAVQLDAV